MEQSAIDEALDSDDANVSLIKLIVATHEARPTPAMAPGATIAPKVAALSDGQSTQEFRPGTRVVVSGLVSRPDLNGKQGHIVALNEGTGRYGVRLNGGKEFNFKPECLSRTVIAEKRVALTDGELHDKAQELTARGNALLRTGDFRGAIEMHEQCRAYGARIKSVRSRKAVEKAALGNLGNAYSSLGQHKKALEHYKLALGISRDIGDREGEATNLCSLGSAYHSLGQ